HRLSLVEGYALRTVLCGDYRHRSISRRLRMVPYALVRSLNRRTAFGRALTRRVSAAVSLTPRASAFTQYGDSQADDHQCPNHSVPAKGDGMVGASTTF